MRDTVLALHVLAGTVGLLVGPVWLALRLRNRTDHVAAWAYHLAVAAVVTSSAYLAVSAPGLWWLLPFGALTEVLAVTGHPRPHDLPRVGSPVGAWPVLHVRGAGVHAGGRARGAPDQSGRPLDQPEESVRARHPAPYVRAEIRRPSTAPPASDVTCDTSAPIGHGGDYLRRLRGTTVSRGATVGHPGRRGTPMTTAEPVRPAVPRGGEVQASVLAAFQLVEDARYLGRDRRPRRRRAQLMAERAVADRKLLRDLRAS